MNQYQPGDRIAGEYTVRRVFGGEDQSGMGVVYLVEHRERPTPFVLKTFQRTTSEAARKRFVSEASAWIKAGAHPHIVQAYWVKELAGQLFVAAEYVEPDENDRNSLEDFLAPTPMRPEVILLWAFQFCRGMEYARTKGVLAHRDIKPANLMVDTDGNLKVADFGIAKAIDAHSPDEKPRWWLPRRTQPPESVGMTAAGSAMGTLYYMAPEQFVDARSVDHRADIYSFGVVLYQLASGNRYPYRIRPNATDMGREFFLAHTEQTPVPLDSPLYPVIQRCLEKRPQRRFISYPELEKDLRVVAKDLRVPVPADVRADRKDVELYAKAQSLVALADTTGALNAIDEYVSNFEENSCGWTQKGVIHLERGEYEEALAATRRSIALYPFNSHVWNNLGIVLNRTGAPMTEVQRAYAEALLLDPLNTAAMMNAVGSLFVTGELLDAASLTARALNMSPQKPLILQKAHALLRECWDARNFAAMRVLLDGWAGARPDDVDAWHNLGLLALDEKDWDKAIECFGRVRHLNPEDRFALLQLAKLYFRKKRGKECLACCDTLIQCGYESLVAVSLKARVINFLGQYGAAVAFLEPYLQQNPRNDTLRVVLAEIHEFRDDFDAAITALREAKRILGNNIGEHTAENLQYVETRLAELSVRARPGGGFTSGGDNT